MIIYDLGAEADVLRLLITTWLVTRGGAGDMSTWHCVNMLSCPPEDEAEDNKAVVAMAAAILAGDGPEPSRQWFRKLCPPPTGQHKGPLVRTIMKRPVVRNTGMREELD